MKILKSKKWSIEKELVLKKDQIYVSKEELRTEIIQLYHDTPVKGHRERWKIAELVERNYWWSKITKKVKRYVDRYNTCQRNKNHTKALVEKLIPNTIPEKL